MQSLTKRKIKIILSNVSGVYVVTSIFYAIRYKHTELPSWSYIKYYTDSFSSGWTRIAWFSDDVERWKNSTIRSHNLKYFLTPLDFEGSCEQLGKTQVCTFTTGLSTCDSKLERGNPCFHTFYTWNNILRDRSLLPWSLKSFWSNKHRTQLQKMLPNKVCSQNCVIKIRLATLSTSSHQVLWAENETPMNDTIIMSQSCASTLNFGMIFSNFHIHQIFASDLSGALTQAHNRGEKRELMMCADSNN